MNESTVMRENDKKKEGSSDFFLPLTGQENASRLEEKYERYYDSDDDGDSEGITTQGMVSQWKVESPSKWLDSQTHKLRGKAAVVTGGKTIQRSPRKGKRLVQPPSKQQDCQNLPSTSSVAKGKAISDEKSQSGGRSATRHVESRADDITEYSSDEAETDICHGLSSKYNDGQQQSHHHADSKATKGISVMNKSASAASKEDDNFWAGFSLADTEKPRLNVTPVSAKRALKLSSDDVQPPVVVPSTINQYLRDYQREGIRFLYHHYVARRGAILGDDMGLGKTIQVIGFLSALLSKQGNRMDTVHTIPKFIRQMSDDLPDSPPRRDCKPFLIIGPSAVMYNWLDELDTWGYFTARKFHGADKELCLSDLKKGKLEIVVTTFETFRDNVAMLNEVQWEAVIVDEVHKIKGLKAQVTQALRIINTPCRYGLTGTALQNNMTELWSLLDWYLSVLFSGEELRMAQPGVLGTLEEFQMEFVDVIETGQRHDATKRELALARKQRDKFSELRKKMLLRRTKALIADQLPKKEDLVVMCRLADLQVSVYKAILTHPDMDLVLKAEYPCACRSGKVRASCCYKRTADGTKVWALVFSYMHLMLKAANHTALLIPDHKMKEKQAQLARKVCEVAFKDHPQFLEQARNAAFRTLSDPKYCGKMKILQGLLSVFYANHDKVLIFSYSTKLLDIIEQYVISQGHEYSRIDGKVSSQRRRDIVIQFNTDSNIFLCLISTKAGGLGLNLTGANRVVVFDPNWNPSHDLQAQDRAYRIGQTRDVQVYRLVSAGTIEENIYLRQIYKQQLDEVAIGTSNARRYFHGIQGDKENQGELFGVKNMFALRTGNSCLTMDILKRNEKLERGLAGYDITRYVPPKKDPSTDSSQGSDDDDNDNDGNEDEISIDPDEEEEEDEEFLQMIFGSDRSPIVSSKSQAAGSGLPSTSHKGDNITHTTDPPNAESDSDEEEFSLIPRLHPKSKAEAYERDKPSTSRTDASRQSNTTDVSHLQSDSFSVSGITFSTTVDKSSALSKYNQQSSETAGSTGTRKRGAVSGISWLFSDDDDDEDEEEEEKIEEVDDGNGSMKKKREVKKTSGNHTVDPKNEGPSTSGTNQLHDLDKGRAGKGKRTVKQTANTSAHRGSKKNMSSMKSSGASTSKSKKTKFTSVQSVLESEGVLHTHVNPDVVGSSRAEDHMTRCAMQDVFELHTNTQAPALQCDPYSQHEEEKEAEKAKKGRGRSKVRSKEDHNTKKCIKSGSFSILVGQTPEAIKRQHWSELCKFQGVEQADMAQILVSLSVEERLNVLKQFYIHKYPQLRDVLACMFTSVHSGDVRESESKESKSSAHSGSASDNKKVSSKREEATSSHVGDSHSKPHKGNDISPEKRANTRKSKRPAASILFDMSTMASPSQESVTARTPENLSSSDGEADDYFLPGPSSSTKKRQSNLKVNFNKSQVRTRLRKTGKIQYDGDEESFNEKTVSDDKGQSFQYHSSVPAILDINQSVSDDKTVRETHEDIPTLLFEMGDRTSAGNGKNIGIQEQNISDPNEISEKPKDTLSKTDVNKNSTSQAVSKPRSERNQKGSSPKRRNFACVLDDIFCSSLDESDSKPSPSKKSKVDEEREGGNGDFTTNSRPSSSKVTEATGIPTSQTQTEDSDFFDFLTTSTLKDEKVDGISRSRKLQTSGKKTIAGGSGNVSGKSKREKDCGRQVAPNDDDDVDDLEGFHMKLSKVQFGTGSESLFS